MLYIISYYTILYSTHVRPLYLYISGFDSFSIEHIYIYLCAVQVARALGIALKIFTLGAVLKKIKFLGFKDPGLNVCPLEVRGGALWRVQPVLYRVQLVVPKSA